MSLSGQSIPTQTKIIPMHNGTGPQRLCCGYSARRRAKSGSSRIRDEENSKTRCVASQMNSAASARASNGATAEPAPVHPDLDLLSRRERDVVTQLLQGHRVVSIAELLEVSEHTVRNHLKSIFRKLGRALPGRTGRQAAQHVRRLLGSGLITVRSATTLRTVISRVPTFEPSADGAASSLCESQGSRRNRRKQTSPAPPSPRFLTPPSRLRRDFSANVDHRQSLGQWRAAEPNDRVADSDEVALIPPCPVAPLASRAADSSGALLVVALLAASVISNYRRHADVRIRRRRVCPCLAMGYNRRSRAAVDLGQPDSADDRRYGDGQRRLHLGCRRFRRRHGRHHHGDACVERP